MRLKYTIIGTIATLLAAAFFFCAGMHYTITHMTIDTDGYGDSAIITLNDNVYIHGINDYPLDYDLPMTYCEPLNID